MDSSPIQNSIDAANIQAAAGTGIMRTIRVVESNAAYNAATVHCEICCTIYTSAIAAEVPWLSLSAAANDIAPIHDKGIVSGHIYTNAAAKRVIAAGDNTA